MKNSFMDWLFKIKDEANHSLQFTEVKRHDVANSMIMTTFKLSNNKEFVICDNVYVSYDKGFYLYSNKSDDLYRQLKWFTTHVNVDDYLADRLWVLISPSIQYAQ